MIAVVASFAILLSVDLSSMFSHQSGLNLCKAPFWFATYRPAVRVRMIMGVVV